MSYLAYKNQILYTPPKDPATGVFTFEERCVPFEMVGIEATAEVSTFIMPIVGSNNLIPTMTSDTAPSGIASASTNRNNADPAFYAMNSVLAEGRNGDIFGWLPDDTDLEPWLSYEWGDDKLIPCNLLVLTTFNWVSGRYNYTIDQQRIITVEGLTEEDIWENCLASGSQLTIDFKKWLFIDYNIELNGNNYKAIRIKGIDNQSWCDWNTNKTFVCWINSFKIC